MMESHRFKSLFDRVSNAFEKAGKKVGFVAEETPHNWNRMTEAWYRQSHGRLPGSNRTARLRKKRRTMIDRWVAKEMA